MSSRALTTALRFQEDGRLFGGGGEEVEIVAEAGIAGAVPFEEDVADAVGVEVGVVEPEGVGSILKEGALVVSGELDEDVGGEVEGDEGAGHEPGAIVVVVDDAGVVGFIEVGEVEGVDGAAGEDGSGSTLDIVEEAGDGVEVARLVDGGEEGAGAMLRTLTLALSQGERGFGGFGDGEVVVGFEEVGGAEEGWYPGARAVGIDAVGGAEVGGVDVEDGGGVDFRLLGVGRGPGGGEGVGARSIEGIGDGLVGGLATCRGEQEIVEGKGVKKADGDCGDAVSAMASGSGGDSGQGVEVFTQMVASFVFGVELPGFEAVGSVFDADFGNFGESAVVKLELEGGTGGVGSDMVASGGGGVGNPCALHGTGSDGD